MSQTVHVQFDHGTLAAPAVPDQPPIEQTLQAVMALDPRTGVYRAPAHRYRELIQALRQRGITVTDGARRYEPLELRLTQAVTPYPHQREALAAWEQAGCRGQVILPTGAGKTLLAVLCMAKTQRPTLVVVPTIDLMLQWRQVLETHFGQEVGMLGGGEHERKPITVTTYDSATAQTEFHGNCFGLLVCDECHHLPAPSYRFVAEGSIAPFRLGLSATPERADGGEQVCAALLGPICYRAEIDGLMGEYLAPYEVVRIAVPLSAEDKRLYDAARQLYIAFLRHNRLAMGSPDGWARFVMLSQRSDAGRRAFAAYREQRRIAFASRAKMDALWKVLVRHRQERVLVFTDDNDTVYRLSRQMLLPTITHQTKPNERKDLLGAFSRGDLPVLLTSRVLNEGVDVPDANVGVVLSGSGSVREHVQRLGRLLRKQPGKHAVLYEICTAEAAEANISARRRQHRAYSGTVGLATEEPPC